MKKRVLSVVLAAVLTVACAGSVTAFAASSPSTRTTDVLAQAVRISGSVGSSETLSEDILAQANEVASRSIAQIVADSVSGIGEGYIDDNGELVLDDDATPLGAATTTQVVAAFDFTPSDKVREELKKNGKATVEFNVKDIHAGDTVVIIHYNRKTATWENITPSYVGEGVVAGEFTSFSPIVIAKAANTGAGSPLTNDTMSIAAIIGVIALAGAFLFGRKAR